MWTYVGKTILAYTAESMISLLIKKDGRWDTDILVTPMDKNHTGKSDSVVISLSFVKDMTLKKFI